MSTKSDKPKLGPTPLTHPKVFPPDLPTTKPKTLPTHEDGIWQRIHGGRLDPLGNVAGGIVGYNRTQREQGQLEHIVSTQQLRKWLTDSGYSPDLCPATL